MNKVNQGLMIIKKIIIAVFLLSTLNGCMQNTALLGPAYTLSTSGNMYHAGLSYTSAEVITTYTGKTPGENIKDLLSINEKDSEFEKIVKKRFIETRKKLKIPNQ